MLKGKKTYLTAAGVAGLAVLHFLGVINDATYQTLLALLGAGGLASLRSAINDPLG